LKEALAGGSMQTSKTKRNIVFSDVEEEVRPQKKKTKVPVESDTETEEVSINEEPPKTLKTCVFSRASEDSRDTNANTEVSSNLDDPGNVSTGEMNTSDAKQGISDDEEWEYSAVGRDGYKRCRGK
jgi:hypothetical protein